MSTLNSKTFLTGGEQVRVHPSTDDPQVLGTLLYADLLGLAVIPHKLDARDEWLRGPGNNLDPTELGLFAEDHPVFIPWAGIARVTVIAEGAR